MGESIPHPDAPPRTLGRYELLFRIASGGMAEVFAARVRGEAGFQKLVAIKRMLPSIADDDEFVTMFLDEARVAANIDSPHVVSTSDLGRAEDGSLYIVMELVVGTTLARIFKWHSKNRTASPPPMAVELLVQAARGLHDAHEARTPIGAPLEIVHRDISPQNILVGVDGRVRITDFGVARAVLRMTKTVGKQIKGKFAYCSPEQLRPGPIDRRADVFSLGVVAWELLAGQRLFVGEHPMETMERVKNMPVPLVHQVGTGIPPRMSDVIAKALMRDPERRFATAQELGDALLDAARSGDLRLPPRDAIGKYVRSAGGPALSKVRENIKRAMIHADALEPVPEALSLGLTPSGVTSGVVASEPSSTDPRTGHGSVSVSEPDASAPGRGAASPSSLLPPPTEGPRLFDAPALVAAPARSRAPLLAVLVVLALAGGAGAFFALGGDEGREPPAAAAPAPPDLAPAAPDAPPPPAARPPEIEPEVEPGVEARVEPTPPRPRPIPRPAPTLGRPPPSPPPVAPPAPVAEPAPRIGAPAPTPTVVTAPPTPMEPVARPVPPPRPRGELQRRPDGLVDVDDAFGMR